MTFNIKTVLIIPILLAYLHNIVEVINEHACILDLNFNVNP